MHTFTHFAYLDAGTGSLIIQSVIGVLAGVLVFGRRVIGNAYHKIASLFGKSDTTKVSDTKPVTDNKSQSDNKPQ